MNQQYYDAVVAMEKAGVDPEIFAGLAERLSGESGQREEQRLNEA
ncbi:MAG: hypothetical protein R3E95_21645 [Thiolinea sp.]